MTIRWQASGALALALGVVGLQAPTVSAQTGVEPVKCGKVPTDVREGRDVSCAYVTVPLRHGATRDKRTVQVAVSIVAADRPSGKRPLIVLSGGPGEPIAAAGAALASKKAKGPVAALNADRDLILVDQRGAGASKPALECTPEEKAAGKGPVTTTDRGVRALFVKVYSSCAQRLRKDGIDLTAFTTSQIAQDLNTVRKALKLAKADIFATSYGTKVALSAARRDSSWTGKIVLSSTVAPGVNFITGAPKSYARALRVANEACAETACRAKFGDLEAKLEAALIALEAKPLKITVKGAETTVTAGAAATVVFAAFYSAEGIEALPALIDALAKRDVEQLKKLGSSPTSELSVTQGQQFAVLCAGEAATLTVERIRASFAGLPRAARLFSESQPAIGIGIPTICRAFGPQPTRPGGRRAPQRLDGVAVPVLVVSGLLDQITPPSYGQAVADALPDATHVVVPAGHSPVLNLGSCGVELLRTFLAGKKPLPLCGGDLAR